MVYLPPRMPWYQPIEHLFSWLKRDLSDGATQAQARITPYASVYGALANFTVQMARNLINHIYG